MLTNQAAIAPELVQVLTLGLGGALFGATELLALWKPANTKVRRLYLFAALPLILLAVAAATTGQPLNVWLPPLLLALGAAGVWAVTAGRGQAIGSWLRVAARPAICLMLAIGSPAFAYWRMQPVDEAPLLATDLVETISADPIEANFTPNVAMTDAGRMIQLFTKESPERSTLELQEMEARLIQSQSLIDGVIRTANADDSYNCHGWVFTDGQCWVKGEEVDLILKDNGYRLTRRPRPGDVVVYRDDQGVVIHTGIVRAVGQKGFVLIESKWGQLGRFIHRPEVRPYDATCTYYHSHRFGGNLLIGLPPAAEQESEVASPAPVA